MKYPLLKMVQLILSSMDGDEVNSIDATAESVQVVDIVEQTYNDVLINLDLPEHYDLFELNASSDPTRPTLMYLPDGVAKIEWIQYNNAEDLDTVRNMVDVRPMQKYEFFKRMNTLDSAQDNVYQFNYEVGTETFDVRGHNDRFPSNFTTVDDRTLIFDHYREDLDATLVKNKTMCYGQIIPVFVRSDDFVPDLDPQNFSYFFNEAKSQAFIELKQIQNAKADQRARQARLGINRTKHRTPQGSALDHLPNYGRRRPL